MSWGEATDKPLGVNSRPNSAREYVRPADQRLPVLAFSRLAARGSSHVGVNDRGRLHSQAGDQLLRPGREKQDCAGGRCWQIDCMILLLKLMLALGAGVVMLALL